MTEREALHRAICQHPEDNTARLVFADWLDEQGNPDDAERAEYIRLSIRLESPPDAASFLSMANWHNDSKRVEQTLLRNQEKWTHLECPRGCSTRKERTQICTWCGGTGNMYNVGGRVRIADRTIEDRIEWYMRGVTYSRGFPVGITCSMQELFTGYRSPNPTEWARIFVERTPVTMFKPTDYRPRQIRRISEVAVWTDVIRIGYERYPYSLPTWLFDLVWEWSKNYANCERKETHAPEMGSRLIGCYSIAQANEILSRAIGEHIRSYVCTTGSVGSVSKKE